MHPRNVGTPTTPYGEEQGLSIKGQLQIFPRARRRGIFTASPVTWNRNALRANEGQASRGHLALGLACGIACTAPNPIAAGRRPVPLPDDWLKQSAELAETRLELEAMRPISATSAALMETRLGSSKTGEGTGSRIDAPTPRSPGVLEPEEQDPQGLPTLFLPNGGSSISKNTRPGAKKGSGVFFAVRFTTSARARSNKGSRPLFSFVCCNSLHDSARRNKQRLRPIPFLGVGGQRIEDRRLVGTERCSFKPSTEPSTTIARPVQPLG